MKISFVLNGDPVTVEAPMTRRLLDVLRTDLGLTGTKEGCGEGECGACQVYLDGELVNACLVPMANAVGREVVTIEGFSQTRDYTRIAEAFRNAGAVQCGFCTPGMVMATGALIRTTPHPDRETILEALSGNLCRCTGYQTLVEAIETLSEEE